MVEVLRVVLSLSLSGALVAAVLFALKPLYRGRFSPTWQYYIWMLVLLRMVLPFALPEINLTGALFASPVQRPEVRVQLAPQQTAMVDVPSEAPQVFLEDQADALPALPWAAIAADVAAYAWVAWLAIGAMLLVRKVTSYHSFTRFIRAGWRPVEDAAVLDALEEARILAGLRHGLPLYQNPLATSPMLVGILRPVIVLPNATLAPEALRLTLLHELIHYKRQDILYKWLVQLVACLHWFNPMIYLVRREIQEACELSCDEQVLLRVAPAERKVYGDALLQTLDTSGRYGDTVVSLTMSEEGKKMKERLSAIAGHTKRPGYAAIVAMLLTVVLFCGTAMAGAYVGEEALTESEQLTDIPDTADNDDKDDGDDWDGFNDDFVNELDERSGWVSTNYTNGRFEMNTTVYSDGYFIGLTYDSSYEAKADDTIKNVPQPLVIPAAFASSLEDAQFVDALSEAVETFMQNNDRAAIQGTNLRVSSVEGPYLGEDVDALLARFVEEGQVAKVSALAVKASQQAVDAAVDTAYNRRDVAVISVLFGYASDTVRRDTLRQAVTDGRPEVISQLSYIASQDAEELTRRMVERLNPSTVSLLVDKLTKEQAQEIAEAAYAALDTGVMSIVVGALDEEDRADIHARAVEAKHTGIAAVTAGW